jgi:Protein of unknown function (DUF3551)
MRFLALATFAFAAWMAMSPARAQTYGNTSYPVCLQGYGRFDQIDCGYMSFDQCRLSAWGLAAQCIANPYYAPTAAPEPRMRHRHRAR